MTTLEAYAERRNYVHYGKCRLWWLETVISIQGYLIDCCLIFKAISRPRFRALSGNPLPSPRLVSML
jgi:hypothetical protein